PCRVPVARRSRSRGSRPLPEHHARRPGPARPIRALHWPHAGACRVRSRGATGDERNANNLWTRADFARQAPGIDWDAFFAAAKLSKQQSFVVWQPGAVTGAAALVASQPLATWLDYLRFHVIHAHVEVLPRAFAEEAPVLRGGEASSQPGSRAQ